MKNSKAFPIYVRTGLFGINSKKIAYMYFWLSVVISAVSVIMGFYNKVYFFGVLFLLAALWYFLVIKWMDSNSKW